MHAGAEPGCGGIAESGRKNQSQQEALCGQGDDLRIVQINRGHHPHKGAVDAALAGECHQVGDRIRVIVIFADVPVDQDARPQKAAAHHCGGQDIQRRFAAQDQRFVIQRGTDAGERKRRGKGEHKALQYSGDRHPRIPQKRHWTKETPWPGADRHRYL